MTSEPETRRSPVGLAAIGGFVLGAATVLLVVWLYGQGGDRTPWPAPAPATATSPAAPASPEVGPTSIPRPPPYAPVVRPAPAPETGGAPPPLAGSPSPGPSASPASPTDLQDLARRQLLLPVAGVKRESLVDSFEDDRSGGRAHHALDILAPRNTPILAVEDGTIAKLFNSRLGGITIYQFDPSATYSYYYAHLERYADGLQAGDRVRRGQVLGYVGTSGDAPPETPHLHFEIVRLNPDKHWWQGTPIDPFLVLRGEDHAAALGR